MQGLKVHGCGRVGSDPKVSEAPTFRAVDFRFCENKVYKNKDGEWVTREVWHNLKAYNEVADAVAKNVRSGDLFVIIDGALEQRKDPEDPKIVNYYIKVLLFESVHTTPRS